MASHKGKHLSQIRNVSERTFVLQLKELFYVMIYRHLQTRSLLQKGSLAARLLERDAQIR